MREKIKYLITHPMITGSTIIFIGSLFASFLSFLFNLYMTRNLTTADYGTFASLVSLATIVSLPATAVSPLIIHFAASYFAHNELGKVKNLFLKVFKPLLLCGIVLLLFFTFFSNLVGGFLHFSNPWYSILIGIIILVSFVGVVNLTLLQARLSFNFLTIYTIVGGLLKFICGVVFVFLGLGVSGAMAGLVVSYIIPYFLTYIPLRFLIQKNTIRTTLKIDELFSYGIPSSLTQLSLTSLVMSDIMLVKHFFSASDAGIYALLSVISKVIFFFSAPIGTVMFPLIVQKYTKKQPFIGTFIMAFILVLLPTVLITSIFITIPEYAINFFSKSSDSIRAVPYLGMFGIIIGIYSLVSLLTNFLLSIKQTAVVYILITASIIQIGGIILFHESFAQVLILNISIMSLLLGALLLYYLRLTTKVYSYEK